MATAPVAVRNRAPARSMRRDAGQAGRVNVGDPERWVSLAAGGALALYGLRRGTLGGLVLAGLGGSLVYRGATGHCSLFEALGVNTAERRGPATSVPAGRGVRVERAVTINR